jgi:hypothetical protein
MRGEVLNWDHRVAGWASLGVLLHPGRAAVCEGPQASYILRLPFLIRRVKLNRFDYNKIMPVNRCENLRVVVLYLLGLNDLRLSAIVLKPVQALRHDKITILRHLCDLH